MWSCDYQMHLALWSCDHQSDACTFKVSDVAYCITLSLMLHQSDEEIGRRVLHTSLRQSLCTYLVRQHPSGQVICKCLSCYIPLWFCIGAAMCLDVYQNDWLCNMTWISYYVELETSGLSNSFPLLLRQAYFSCTIMSYILYKLYTLNA